MMMLHLMVIFHFKLAFNKIYNQISGKEKNEDNDEDVVAILTYKAAFVLVSTDVLNPITYRRNLV